MVIDRRAIKRNIEQGLEKAELIENLYNAIFIQAKRGKIKDIERVTELLVELEKIRLMLEFKDYDLTPKVEQTKACVKCLTE